MPTVSVWIQYCFSSLSYVCMVCAYVVYIAHVMCVAGSITQGSITREDTTDLVTYAATGNIYAITVMYYLLNWSTA